MSSFKTLDTDTPMKSLSVSPWVHVSPQCEDPCSRVDWRASKLYRITKTKVEMRENKQE